MLKPRIEVRRFASLMEGVLRDNDYKDGWHMLEPQVCLDRIGDERIELENALRAFEETTTKSDALDAMDEVFRELADLANYAMMAHDVLRTMRDGKVK